MESILKKIGPYGKFQKFCTLIVGLISILTSTTIYSTVFILAEPEIECVDLILNMTISNSSNKCDLWQTINKTEFECKFKLNEFGTNLIADWGLVCNKSVYASLIQTFYLIGTLLSLTMGYLADKFGRKRSSLVISIIILLIYILNDIIDLNSLNISITTRYIIYAITQVINGIMNNSIFNITFILLFEITSVNYHTIVSNINLYSYVIGELLVCFVSFVSQDWQIINWSIGAYSGLIVVLIALFLPESPSYYLAKKDYKQAYLIIEKIAKTNKIKDIITYEEFEQIVVDNKKTETKSYDKKITALSYILESKFNKFKSIALILIYFGLTVTYFGVSLGITSIGNMNPYLIYLLSCLAEIIGYVACHLNDKFRRKYVFILFLGLASVTCLLVAVLPNKNDDSIFVSVFALIGKAMASGAFNISYSYCSAMFPAIIRNTMSLSVSGVGRVGSIISPIINLLGRTVWKPFPYLIFSSFSLIGCTMIAILPEPESFD